MENLKRDLENNFASNPHNIEVLESKSEDLLLLAYKQLEIRAKNKCEIKRGIFLNCLKQTNEFNAKPDEKRVTLKFTNFTFDFDTTDNDLAEQLSKIGIYYEDCKFKNYEFENYEFKTIKFENCTFEKINFRNCHFNGEFYFEKCTAKEADFSFIEFRKNTYFNNATFSDYADFHGAEFEAVACFYGAKFEKPMNFSSVVFRDFNKANFINLNIEKINFDNIKTYIGENYENGLQKEEIDKLNKQKAEIEKIEEDIKECEEKSKSTLQKIQNFKFEIKKQNDKDSNTLIEMQKIINKTEEELNNINKQNKEKTKLVNDRKKILNTEFTINQLKHKIRCANNFRDSFRAIKHSLIEINNNLEASNFHKLELYAKEIELDYITELERYKNKNISFVISNLSESESFARKHMEDLIASKIKEIKINIKNYKQNNDNRWKNLKYFFDFFILAFYRNISEHHTDFIKILNFTITMIAFFGICIYILENFLNWEILKSKPDLTIIDAIAI